MEIYHAHHKNNSRNNIQKAKHMTTTQSKLHIYLLLFSVLFIFNFVNKSTVYFTGSDAKGSLLVSQQIINNQTIKIDKYKNFPQDYAVHKKNDHYYYYFPLGTSISAIPFVYLETKIFNKKMDKASHDRQTQKLIASFIAVFIFLLLYEIAKYYLSQNQSLFIALAFWMGTSLSSTLGQALWSQNFATLYTLLAIFFTLKITKEDKLNYLYILAFVLFMAYFTRPTLSLLTITLVLFLFLSDKKKEAIKTAIIVAFFLFCFVLFSIYEFDQLLPDYYMPKRLSSDTFWLALYGNLFSPARGLLVYSPFLLLLFIDIKTTYTIIKKEKVLLVILAWIVLHLIIISKFPHWWAGWSYGSRFTVDILPAIYLIFIIYLSTHISMPSTLKHKFISLYLIATIAISFYFNAVQGLYNKHATFNWNAKPNIDTHTHYLFDWKYPQFLYNKEKHKQRVKESKKEQQK